MPSDFTLLNHYTVFIYPFLHNIRADNKGSRIRSLEESWVPWWSRLENDIASALDNTFFFLPYIRDVLFPETIAFKDEPPGLSYENWARQIRSWNERGLTYFSQQLPADAVLRLTYKQPLLQQIQNVEIVEDSTEDGVNPGLGAGIEWIDAVLFPSGIGFLMLKVVLRQNNAVLDHLIDLNYNLRLVHAPNINWRLASLRFDRRAGMFSVRDLLDFLTQGMGSDDGMISDLGQWKEHVARISPQRLSETEAGQVYGERCHVFSYACVNANQTDGSKLSNGVFESRNDRLAFEYASTLPIGSTIDNRSWIPSLEQVQRLKAENQVSIWNAWTGMTFKESAVFLGTEDIAFNREVLPRNVENDYLPLYVYSLYQKYQLFVFADQLMRKGAYVAQHLDEVRALVDQFMDFRTKYWFNEVTRKALGSELYGKFQQGIDSVSLFNLVSEQVKDLKEHYEEKRRRRIDLLLNIFTFVFLPVSAAIGIFGMNFVQGSPKAFLIVIAVILAVSLGIWKWWTEESGPPTG